MRHVSTVAWYQVDSVARLQENWWPGCNAGKVDLKAVICALIASMPMTEHISFGQRFPT